MSFRASMLLALVGACSFDHSVPNAQGDGGGSNSGDDGGIDSPMVSDDALGDAQSCFGTFKSVCLTTLPTNDITVDVERTINTDTGCPVVASQGTGQTLCVVVARTFHINAPIRGSGPRPLVLLATETIDISAGGVVDVGSYKLVSGTTVSEFVGAAAATGATLCGTPTNGGNDFSMGPVGGGGGAGGSFGGKGGNGARGLNNNGGQGGTAANATGTPSFMRGGCRGTAGGQGNFASGGIGGAGGGAVLLIAGTSITNAGQVRAGGMGGYGAGNESGGGGGGSGGMIVLDAPSITNSGVLNANGAGGGEGGGETVGGSGGSSALTGAAAAAGGTGALNGGDGGDGSWATTLSGAGGAIGNAGAGAGGGGAGVIRIYPVVTLGGTVSPPPS